LHTQYTIALQASVFITGIHWLLATYIISFTPLVPQLSRSKLLLSFDSIIKHFTPLLSGHSYLEPLEHSTGDIIDMDKIHSQRI